MAHAREIHRGSHSSTDQILSIGLANSAFFSPGRQSLVFYEMESQDENEMDLGVTLTGQGIPKRSMALGDLELEGLVKDLGIWHSIARSGYRKNPLKPGLKNENALM